jgi:hypothetical protein
MNDANLDRLLTRARVHTAPAGLWPAIAVRAARPRLRPAAAAALLLAGALGYGLAATVLRPAAGHERAGIAGLLDASIPYLADAGAPPAEPLLLQRLSEELLRRNR